MTAKLVNLPLSEVQGRFEEIAEAVTRTRGHVRLSRNGQDEIVMISAEEYESLRAALELSAGYTVSD